MNFQKGPQGRTSVLKLLASLAISLIFVPVAEAQGTFLVEYQATFSSGIGGLPVTQVQGSYTFSLMPGVLINSGATAQYEGAIHSWSLNLNGTLFSGNVSNAFIRIDDNIQMSGSNFRDAFNNVCYFNQLYTDDVFLKGAGLQFEQISANPTALNSLALQTSTAEMSGFAPQEQYAVLLLQNPHNGTHYAAHGLIQSFSITPVPEPTVTTLFCLGASMLYLRRRKLD